MFYLYTMWNYYLDCSWVLNHTTRIVPSWLQLILLGPSPYESRFCSACQVPVISNWGLLRMCAKRWPFFRWSMWDFSFSIILSRFWLESITSPSLDMTSEGEKNAGLSTLTSRLLSPIVKLPRLGTNPLLGLNCFFIDDRNCRWCRSSSFSSETSDRFLSA